MSIAAELIGRCTYTFVFTKGTDIIPYPNIKGFFIVIVDPACIETIICKMLTNNW